MSDKTPASLTSSLLARKGSAAPSAENAGEADGTTEMASHVEGTAADPEPLDSFLTRGPDPVFPDPESERSPLDRVLEESDSEPSRSRRAPLIILAILLVFVLAGAGWFAASIFLRGGEERSVASVRTQHSAQSPRANTGLQPAASQATSMAPPSVGFPAAQAGGNDEPVSSASSSLTAVQALEPAGPIASDAPPAETMAGPATPDPIESGGSGPARAMATGEPSPPQAAMDPPRKPERIAAASVAPIESAEAAPVADPVLPSATRSPKEKEAAAPKAAAAPPPPPRPPVQMAARPAGTHGVQLASVSTRAQANRAIERLSRRLASVLDGTALLVRTATLRDHGTVYRIQTPAVLSAADANRMCARLKAAKQPCFVFAQ